MSYDLPDAAVRVSALCVPCHRNVTTDGSNRCPHESAEDDMVEIPLTRGMVALVDPEDAERIGQFKWSYGIRGRSAYAIRSAGSGSSRRLIYMHREILGVEPGVQVDHANGSGLDNRRSNLRACTRGQNQVNRDHRPSRSGYRGVWPQYGTSRWQAMAKKDGKRICLGSFATAEQAARAYDAYVRVTWGPFARLNFPEGAAHSG